MKDVLFLDVMLTPKIITFVYWLLLLVALALGLGAMFYGSGFTLLKLFVGLGIIIVGGVGIRMWCELLIVLFKIHRNIRKITEGAAGQTVRDTHR